MTASPLDFWVGILNYGTKDLLLENLEGCLRSGIPADRLFVWDNRSEDGSLDAARKRFPQVRSIGSDRNLGYAAGMNRIVAECEAPRVVLVTADCLVTSQTVDALTQILRTHEDVAIAGCRILDRRTGRVQSEGGDVTFPAGVPLSRRWQADPDSGRPSSLEEVAYVDGAVLAVDREKFRSLGGFDESYFAYQDDVDLCWRARLRGYRVVCTTSASASHATSAAFRRRGSLRWVLSERNRLANNLKNLGVANVVVAILYENVYFLGITLGAGFMGMPGYRRAYYAGLASLIRGSRGVLTQRRRVQRLRTRSDAQVLAQHLNMGLLRLAKALSRRAALARQMGA